MNMAQRSMRCWTKGILVMLVLAGCSDRSRNKFTVESIVGIASGSSGQTYMEVDLVGNFASSHCFSIQDSALVTVRMDAPGLVGPSLRGYITGTAIDYY